MDAKKPWPNTNLFRFILAFKLRLLFPLVVVLSLVLGYAIVSGLNDLVFKVPSITKGPVLLRLHRDRAAVMWETNTEGTCWLYYGKNGTLDNSLESVGERFQYGIKSKDKTSSKKTVFIYRVWLKDLEPGQVYCYRVVGPAVRSKTYSFRTVPDKADEVRFIIYADSRSNPATYRKLVRIMIKKKADFIVHNGDLVYDGDCYKQWGPQFFTPLRSLVESVPIYVAKGNHDGRNGNYEKLLVPPGEDNCFNFDYGPVHFLCIDNISKDQRIEDQLNLIAEDAKASDANWKFVTYHKPSLNFGHHWSDWGHPDALPTFAEAGIDFVVTGDSHQYERFKPIAPPNGSTGNYVTYITSGGGGAHLHDVEQSVYHACARKVHHFCLFRIKGNKLTMDAIDIKGNIIDHLEITKIEGKPNKEYLKTAVSMAAVQAYQDVVCNRPK